MITAVRRRWSALNNAVKQMLFVGGVIVALAYAAAILLGAVTGEWSGLGAVAAMTGIGTFLVGLMWLAARLFPDEK